MDGLTAKTLRQLRRPSRDAPTPTLTRRAGLFRLADALQAEGHCPPLLEQEWQSIEDHNMGFLRLLGSVLFALILLELVDFILSSFGFGSRRARLYPASMMTIPRKPRTHV